MPTYDYKCVECGHRFDVFKSISSTEKTVCPKCGGEVARVYEGKWAMGKSGASAGGCSCGGNCAGCAGCGQ